MLILIPIAIVAVVLLSFLGSRLVVRVPELSGSLDMTRSALTESGLKVEAVRADGGSTVPLPLEDVVGGSVREGGYLLRGMTVTLETKPPSATVPMPDIVGLFEPDAMVRIDDAGLVSTTGGWVRQVLVVVEQTPAPGTLVPFGSRVSYRAVWPHPKSGPTDPEVKALHGVIYLRNGVEGASACTEQCHTVTTCAGPDCHSSKAFMRFSQGASETAQ